MKTSVEVEYWVIDPDGALAPAAPLAADLPFAEEEFVEPLFELKTPPCATIKELRETFADRLRLALEAAAERDRLLVPLGTPIDAGPIETLPSDRTRIQEVVVGDPFAHTKHCAGTHVHVEQRNVADQLNVLTALDPALALCHSSPYCGGQRVAASARARCYRGRSYADLPDHGRLWPYTGTVAEWKRRLEKRYAEFVERAVERGIDRERVETEFSPFDAVWTPIRLRREMPTVEWRAPDATLPSELLRLVEGVREVMDDVHTSVVRIEGEEGERTEDEIVLPRFEALSEYVERAIHDGLASLAVTAYLERMGFRVGEYGPLTHEFEADRIEREDVRGLRLEYAERLREDVAGLTG
ncbi:glutamate-cysteine ligase family protein [Saliphagus infecundisoli]|uniref:Glutamate-cysteine ligase family protein n=1 Tax=Saliphagus infecundisoli TaxID=1849069 RepID=A0ABD5QFG1_9EURY|nr:glutamate-cysteine ligase family protein [Saliphagus infecundisoli]